mgnify:CR=1 FL=1
MKQQLIRFNTWYDTLEEPKRQLVAILLISPVFLVVGLLPTSMPPFWVLATLVAYALGLLIMRHWWLTSNPRP